MSKKKEIDFLEGMIDQFINDEAFRNQSISEFNNNVKTAFNEQAKNYGYDSVPDFIKSKISESVEGIKVNNGEIIFDDAYMESMKCKDFDSRYHFVINQIQHVVYENSFRGYYKNGHQEAISRYLEIIDTNRNNLNKIEDIVNKEIHDFKEPRKNKKYAQGYLDGLKFIKECLNKSKVHMMDKITLAISQ